MPIRLFCLRLSAAGIDLLTGAVLALVLSRSSVGYFFATRAVIMLRIGRADTIWKGPVPMMIGIFGPFVYVLPLAILLVLLSEPVTGSSPGKRVMGLKVVPPDNAVLSRAMLWRRSAIKTSLFWGLIAALLSGSWVLALCSVIVGCALLCSMVLTLIFPVRPIHDVLSHTCVARVASG